MCELFGRTFVQIDSSYSIFSLPDYSDYYYSSYGKFGLSLQSSTSFRHKTIVMWNYSLSCMVHTSRSNRKNRYD